MKSKTFINTFLMLKFAFKYIRWYCIKRYFMQALFGIYDIWWGVYLMKTLIDSIADEQPPWQIILFIGSYYLYGSLIQCFAAYVYEMAEPQAKQKINDKMQSELFIKASKLDLSSYDDPVFFNDFILAMENADQNIMNTIHITADILKNIIAFLGIGTIIIIYDPIGIIFVALSIIATTFLNSKINKLLLKKDIELTPYNRQRDYSKRVFYLVDYAKEIRLNNIKEKLLANFIKSNREGINVIKKYSKKLFLFDFISNYIFGEFLINFAYMFLLAYKAIVLKAISYGTVAGMVGGLFNFREKLKDLFNEYIELQKNSLYIERYNTFLNYESKISDNSDSININKKNLCIKLSDVSFAYPGCDFYTLKNINMEIKPKEKIAIVGYNGSGKSTLIKLIMRLYDVSGGEILLNNDNIKNLKIQQYREQFGTVFQDFQVFASTVSENVMMDNVNPEDEEKIIGGLKNSGFYSKVNSFPNGIETSLTREFKDDGVILSGGETQKLAIARIFTKPCNIIILDEPSSALDPISEYNLNKSMLEATKDKTVIFISHRLSTTRIADRIFMMENGRIIEQGSHDELMAQGQKYAEMFDMQARKYR